MVCVVCGKNVKPNFNYFCRDCYHSLKHVLGITRSDFIKYLRYGLGVHLHIPEDWDYKQMYNSLLDTHPTLYNLANLLENALFLKLIVSASIGLKPRRDYQVNDYTLANNGVACPDYCGHYSFTNKQVYNKRREIQYLL